MFPTAFSDTYGSKLVILKCSHGPEIYVGHSASSGRNKLNLAACCVAPRLRLDTLLVRSDCTSTNMWIPISIYGSKHP